MSTTIVFGLRPPDLGGYRDHNPVRLFVQARFRAFLRARPDAEGDSLLIALEPGAGAWCAEAAAEERRAFVGVTKAGAWDKLGPALRARMEETAGAALRVDETCLDSPIDLLLSRALGRLNPEQPAPGEAFAVIPRGVAAGRAARALSRLREEGARVVQVSPGDMGGVFRVAGAMEAVRGEIPDALLRVIADSREEIARAMAERLAERTLGDDSAPAWWRKAAERIAELSSLEALLQSIQRRA